MSADEKSVQAQTLNRRGFLRGSALFAAALSAALVAPAVLAQEPQQQQKETEKEKKEREEAEKKKKDQPKEEKKPEEGNSSAEVLRDESGKIYRVCPECGGNMYKQGETWTCESCGYSYVE